MEIYEELKSLKESLYNPFPYSDTDKIQEDFIKELSEEDCLTGDLNTYWMYITGSLSFVLRGNSKKIPEGQIERLHLSFFDIFPQYRFLEGKVAEYPTFYEEYMNYEKTRKLILAYLSSNNPYSTNGCLYSRSAAESGSFFLFNKRGRLVQ